MHLCAIAALGLLAWPGERRAAPDAIETAWHESRVPDVARIETVAAHLAHAPNEPGGRAAGPLTFIPPREVPLTVGEPAGEPTGQFAAALGTAWRPGNLGDRVTLAVGGAGGDGSGDGDGSGTGSGSGGGFFGIRLEGKKIVYVVDCSKSMNHPHDSQWKTRFRRVKAELVESIGRMDESFEFFVIFFNSEARPMPASALQQATPPAKQRYLDWVVRADAVGKTDPRRSMELALRLRPDTIYFLTDGSFDRGVARQLLQLRQKGTVIHTFAFGNPEGETTLKAIAEANGGKYHFIP